jgi:hypothetical protein
MQRFFRTINIGRSDDVSFRIPNYRKSPQRASNLKTISIAVPLLATRACEPRKESSRQRRRPTAGGAKPDYMQFDSQLRVVNGLVRQ